MTEELAAEPAAEPVAAEPSQPTDGGGEAGEQPQQAQPDFGQFQQQLENINRELGQFRKVQSLLDRLPQTIDDRLTKWQKLQQLNQLPPEEREQARQYEQQEKALRDFTRREAQEAFKEAAKDYIPVIEKMQQREQNQVFFSAFSELAGEQAAELEKAGTSMFQRISKDLDSGNEMKIDAAIRFMDTASAYRKAGNPEFELFHAQRELAQQQKANADGVIQNRVQNGKIAAQQPKGKGQASAVSKSMKGMSTADAEKLMLEIGPVEFDKRLKAEMSAAGMG